MRPPSTRSPRGQVMILSVLSMLMLAVMLMFSFNVTQAIHEKMRLQQHADAQAYSVALMQARAFNSLAYTNRAIGTALVAQMALSEYLALAYAQAELHKAFQTAFFIIAGLEFAQCPKFKIQHCIHGIQAIRIALKHGREARNLERKVRGTESAYNQAIEQFSRGMQLLKMGQDMVALNAVNMSRSGADMLEELRQRNAPRSSYNAAVDALSINNFSCALEGSRLPAFACKGKTQTLRERARYLQGMANADRQSFESGSSNFPAIVDPKYIPMSSFLRGLQGNTGSHFFMYDFGGSVGQGRSGARVGTGVGLDSASGFVTGGTVFAQWKHGVGFGTFGKTITAGPRGGRYRGTTDCMRTECFIGFRGGASASDDYGQPTTYGSVRQDLRLTSHNLNDEQVGTANHGAWEVNRNGVVELELIEGRRTQVRLVPTGTAVGVAKGKAYFHQPGRWKQPPNMFDPFWRAKLHPFNRRELLQVLAASGDSNGAMVAARAPVEGN